MGAFIARLYSDHIYTVTKYLNLLVHYHTPPNKYKNKQAISSYVVFVAVTKHLLKAMKGRVYFS